MQSNELKCWTKKQSKDQHFYFTSPSLTTDERYILSISENIEGVHINAIQRDSGKVINIASAECVMRSYVYARGELHGISKASPCLDDERGVVYWIQDDGLFSAKISESPIIKKIANLPSGWWTAYTHVSKDGKYICVPCTDPFAFEEKVEKSQHDQLKLVPWRMLEKGLKSKILVFCTETGIQKTCVEIPFWVTHVQFDPLGTGRILFNCEGNVGSRGNREYPYWGRIWLLFPDGTWHRLFNQIEGETVNHENWNDAGEVVFHGHLKPGRSKRLFFEFSRVLKKLGLISQHQLQNARSHYIAKSTSLGQIVWKVAVNFPVSHAVAIPGRCDEVVADSRDGNIYLIKCYKDGSHLQRILVKHDSTMVDQDCHPHPSMNRKGESVVFASDKVSPCDVYEVSLTN